MAIHKDLDFAHAAWIAALRSQWQNPLFSASLESTHSIANRAERCDRKFHDTPAQ